MRAPRTDAVRREPNRCWHHAGRCVGLAVALALAVPLPAARAESPTPHTRWVSASLLAGSAQPIAAMADYQWDVRPHAAGGLQILVGSGRFAAGARWWRGGSTQGLNLPGVADPKTRTNSFELLGRVRVADWRGLQGALIASGGRMALTYHPDRLTIVTGGTPVEVVFTPVHEWVGGAGLALGASLTQSWAWGFEAERRVFALDTAHRSGASVVQARGTFGDWDARVVLSHAWDW